MGGSELESIASRTQQVLDAARDVAARVPSVTSLDWYSPAGTRFREYVDNQRFELLCAIETVVDAVAAVNFHVAETERLSLERAAS